MQRSTGLLSVLLVALSACAAPPAPTPARPPPVAARPNPADAGTILAIHRVTADHPPAIRILFDGLAHGGTPADAHTAEFIVRTHNGATIAVVQSGLEGLHPGDRVSILRPAASATEPRLQPIGG